MEDLKKDGIIFYKKTIKNSFSHMEEISLINLARLVDLQEQSFSKIVSKEGANCVHFKRWIAVIDKYEKLKKEFKDGIGDNEKTEKSELGKIME